jgi:hypothetical protein
MSESDSTVVGLTRCRNPGVRGASRERARSHAIAEGSGSG